MQKEEGNFTSKNIAINCMEVRRKAANSRHGKLICSGNGAGGYGYLHEIRTILCLQAGKWYEESYDLGKIILVAQCKIVWALNKLVAKKTNSETKEIIEM